MNVTMQRRMLARLAELGGDDTRLTEYIELLESQRQARADAAARTRKRRHAAGLRRAEGYVTARQHEALRVRFPGPRGGVDWQAVADAALEAA